MDLKKTEAAIEAILFTMGESVEVDKIAKAVEQDTETTKKILHNMMDRYQTEDREFRLLNWKMHFKCVPRGICMNF